MLYLISNVAMAISKLVRTPSIVLLPPEVRLTLSESALQRVVENLRQGLSEARARRREIKSCLNVKRRPATCPTASSSASTSSPSRSVSVEGKRELSLGLKRSFGEEMFFRPGEQGGDDIFQATTEPRDSLVLHRRVSSKLNHASSQRGKVFKSKYFSSSISEKVGEEAPTEIDLTDLRAKVRQVRIGQRREKGVSNGKQLLAEFSGFGMKIKGAKDSKNNVNNSIISDPIKELVSLIEVVDSSLSSSEALSILKELGVDYQPRSALGKKNAMATDLSAVLAPKGIRGFC